MSSIPVVTEFVVKRANAESEASAFTAKMQAEAAKMRALNFTIPVKLGAPDVTSLQRLIRSLQQKPLEIPVRLVPTGSLSGATQSIDSTGRITGSVASAGSSSGSLAMTNGRPGVDPSGFMGGRMTTVMSSPAGVQSSGNLVAPLVSAISGLQTAINGLSGKIVSTPAAKRSTTPQRAGSPADDRAYWGDDGNNGYNGGNTDGFVRDENGKLVPPKGRAGRIRRAASSLREYVIGATGVSIAGNSLAAMADYQGAGFGLRGGQQQYAQETAFQEGISSVPLIGGFAQAGADLLSNNARQRAERTIKSSEQQMSVAERVFQNAQVARMTRVYSPFDIIRQNTKDQLDNLGNEMNKPEWIDSFTGVLSSAGQSYRASEQKRILAQQARAFEDATLQNNQYEAVTDAGVASSNRRAGVLISMAGMSFDRQAQLAAATGTIDDQLAQRRAALSASLSSKDVGERGRAERELNSATFEAEQQKLAETSRLKRQFEEEDLEIVSRIEQAKLRARGETYAADVKAYEDAANQKIRLENDLGKKQKMIEERDANLEVMRDARGNVRMQAETAELRKRIRGNVYGAEVDRINRLRDEEIKASPPEQEQAIRDKYAAQIEQLDRGRGLDLDAIRSDTLQRQYRARGQYQMAEVQGLGADFAAQIEAVKGDPTKLREVIENFRARGEELRSSQSNFNSTIFGSASQFASDAITRSLNNDPAASGELDKLEKMISKYYLTTNNATDASIAAANALKEAAKNIG